RAVDLPTYLPISSGVADADIACRAFERYCARGCQDGHDVDDWLAAERELQEASRLAVGEEKSIGGSLGTLREVATITPAVRQRRTNRADGGALSPAPGSEP